ncbi:hypothetical protein GLAREA_09960 [Glarea lozoyensis ATCC 20868]|uniref:Rhodopsin domain-containing protein n=1 Tax=Glarea lozoyensis (strain ATCC 20868 / MF5171) TaxID=1116229 RepID=S3CV57_GLAL2|nr:uncharacterized protein GLAREA_09960 [Glarea lozoyensis ATCC 20868]EPE28839.1 hypothetical protein GLAREA_09960 [Glarea lozoyensis ATCC 20868]
MQPPRLLIFFSTLAFGLRIGARRLKKVPLKSDDYLSGLATLFTWAMAIVLIIGAARGTLGTHTLQNPNTGAVIVTWHEIDTSKLAGISQLLTIVALGVLKMSVVMLYRRIFIGQQFRMISLIVAIMIVAWTVSFLFATIFECGRDLGLLWKSLSTFKKNCGKYKYIQIGHAGSDVITDLIVLALPLPTIWTLRLSETRRFALSLIFLLGLLSTAAGAARLAIVGKDIYGTRTGSRDVRAVETNAMVWSYVEVGVGVVAACLPTLRPWLHRRTPESIVNSVRSKISLQSLGSRSKHGAHESVTETSKSDIELQEYEMLTPKRSNHELNSTVTADRIERVDDGNSILNIPGKIHVQHGVTVEAETISRRP